MSFVVCGKSTQLTVIVISRDTHTDIDTYTSVKYSICTRKNKQYVSCICAYKAFFLLILCLYFNETCDSEEQENYGLGAKCGPLSFLTPKEKLPEKGVKYKYLYSLLLISKSANGASLVILTGSWQLPDL